MFLLLVPVPILFPTHPHLSIIPLNYPPSPPHPLMMRNANTDTSILPVIWWNTVYKHIQWKKMTGQKRNVVMGYNPIRKTPQKGLRIEHWKLIKQEQT